MKSTMRILASSILIALAPMAAAQATGGGDLDTQVRVLDTTAANKGQTLVADKIASNFTNLAGSKENAVKLVNALRTGGDATLTTTTTTPGTGGAPPTTTTTSTSIPTPTGQMGWGNVKIALGLAQDVLLKAGITDPTAAQLQTALNGGTLTRADGTTLEVKGVLQMRADGMGWGQIAKAGGTKVGPVVSSLKQTNAALEKLPPAETTTTAAAPATSKAALATSDKQARGVTTAGGASGGVATDKSSKGVTTAAGGASNGLAKGHDKGVTTAAGGSATTTGASKGITTAGGVSSAGHGNKGLVTAAGAGGATPSGNAHGRGLVTAAGGGATNVAAAGGGKGHGAGLVTAGGGSASGVTTAAGGKGGSNAGGNGNGKGKPGGG
jgi:hypothetical protein